MTKVTHRSTDRDEFAGTGTRVFVRLVVHTQLPQYVTGLMIDGSRQLDGPGERSQRGT